MAQTLEAASELTVQSRAPDNDAGPSAAQLTLPAAQQIFVKNGEAVKFFIQKDLGTIFIAWLSALIKKHGGTIVPTIPLSGYVLIEPQTQTGQRLLAKWDTTTERPDRHVVCYTFVRASIVNGEMLEKGSMKDVKSFFRLEGSGGGGAPVEIWLHEALGPERRKKLAVNIEKHGGITETTELEARIIISPNTKKQEKALFRDLVTRHEENPEKYIEDVEWVEKCIKEQVFLDIEHRVRNKGGRKVGHKRIDYTPEDDEHLVKYIARIIPDEAMGGRLGNNLYIDLENNPEKYPWSKRHSWHSWRNRYKIRQLIIDIAIRDYVKEHPELLDPSLRGTDAAGTDNEEDSDAEAGDARRVYRKGPGSGALLSNGKKGKKSGKGEGKGKGKKGRTKKRKRRDEDDDSDSDDESLSPELDELESEDDADVGGMDDDNDLNRSKKASNWIAAGTRTRKRRRTIDSEDEGGAIMAGSGTGVDGPAGASMDDGSGD